MRQKQWPYLHAVIWIVLILILIWSCFALVSALRLRWTQQAALNNIVHAMVASIDQEEAEYQARVAADTVGGKTPEETLQLYIFSAENRDYRTASKYFIEERQDAEYRKLKEASEIETQGTLDILKQALDSKGHPGADGKEFVIVSPILISFRYYPSDIWKLVLIK